MVMKKLQEVKTSNFEKVSDVQFCFEKQLKSKPFDAERFASFSRQWDAVQDLVQFAPNEVDPSVLLSVERVICDDAQADSPRKVDLVQQAQALVGFPAGAGEFFQEFMSADPNRALLKTLGAPYSARVAFEKSGAQATATLFFKGGVVWPDCLGGHWGFETMRSITVTCRYASWRNRRSRRLSRVQVSKFLVSPKL